MKRLRLPMDAEELARAYAAPHDHAKWSDHVYRVDRTIAFAREYLGAVETVADLSCGSGAIARALVESPILGDLAPGYDYSGPIEETVQAVPYVDAFVCCETLEHLDDPQSALNAIRLKAGRLILSTPVEAWDDNNPEHYWAWSREDVEGLLAAAGFSVDAYDEVWAFYRFGLWGCS
jgi:hypothetical protein